MAISRKIIRLCFGILGLFVGQSCTPKKATSLPNPLTASILIDSSFTTQSLNEHVLVCTKLSEKDLARKDLKTWLRRNSAQVSQKKEAVLLGSFRQYPDAWFYAQIINNSSESQQLVVDEFNRLRCDALEVYTIGNGVAKNWGNLSRHTPFSNYPLPFFTYSIPITIEAKDTLDLVIHTQRHFGVHEVNLNVSDYDTYISTQFTILLTRLFQITIFMILFGVMIILGQIFHYKPMTYLGVYVVTVLFTYLTSWGFTDSISNFSYIGLSGSNISVFGMIIACVPPHLLLIELMKGIPKNEKIFKRVSYSLLGLSLLSSFCFLLPTSLFDVLYSYVNLTLLMIILIFAGIFWIFYCSLLALFRVKVYYLTFGFGFAYLPFISVHLGGMLANKSFIILQSNLASFLFINIGLTIIGVSLLREQLVTRKKLEENLTQLKGTMEDIRKSEVETIGRNLHDNVGNILASVLGYLNLKNQNQEVIKNLVNESINEVRFLSHTLVRQDNLPITEKLEMLVSRFNDFSPIKLYFNDYSLGKLNRIEALRQQNLYMIIQEALTNVVKHSKATRAYIQIFDQDGQLQVTIEDDGIGMGAGGAQEGIGLKNIYKRAELSGFKVTLDSNAAGTNLIIEVHEN